MTRVEENEERKESVKNISMSKKVEKSYKVTITYIQLTDEEAKTKRAIIESIMKKSCRKQVGLI